MNIKNIEERLDFIEFRQQLLFYNSPSNRLFFQFEITRKQNGKIMELMDKCRDMIQQGKDVTSSNFEMRMEEICPQLKRNYHFSEHITQAFHEEGRWREVFEKLYGHKAKS
ncbi:DUF1878 domain-containing protein [Chengkuizengella sp. SCS-71B]|uniref:DUF1878 domain-containing protein n=1 Tax=Chengkuizengella sp. SCS-71B TaxID=3115290 RepID=UPI0032C221A4